MKRHLFSSLLLAVSATALHTHALAVNLTYTTGFRNMQFDVIDLTPDDGAAAGFTVDSAGTYVFGAAHSQTPPYDGNSLAEGVDGLVPWAAGTSYRSANVLAQADGKLGNISAMGSVAREDDWLRASARVTQEITLTLAPHSVLTLSGEWFRDAQLSDSSHAGFHVTADRFFVLKGSDTYWYDTQSYYTLPSQQETAETIWYSVANTSDVASPVSLLFAAWSEVQFRPPAISAVTQVPEPSTWAMLLAGLGVAGAAARRRRG